MPKNEPISQKDRERYKEQFGEAINGVTRFLFRLPDSEEAPLVLLKLLGEMPPEIAADLSIDIETVAQELQKIKESIKQDGQISLFPEDEDEAVKEEATKTIEHLLSTIPKQHLIPNHKLMNVLTKDIVGAGQKTIRVSSANAKKQIPVICDLAYDEKKIQLDSRLPITEYDRNVYNAVTSLYVYGDQSHVVTPAMVYRAMTGMNDAEKPSPQQIGAVTRSLNRMSCIRVRLDCTEELRSRRIPHNLDGYIRAGRIGTYLLNTKDYFVEAGGKKMWAYKIEEPPILYRYSKALKQVLSVPASLLDIKAIDAAGQITGNRIANTESRIAIKGYLLRRIEGMKNQKNNLDNSSIALQSYERDGKHHAGLYEIGGNATPSTREAVRIRDYVTAALDYWKAEGYIKGYVWIKSGKKIVRLEIQP